MPVTRAIQRDSVSLTNSPNKNPTYSSQLETHYETTNGGNPTNEITSPKRSLDLSKKAYGLPKHISSVSAHGTSHSQASRRLIANDDPTMRRRLQADTQHVMSSLHGLKQQLSTQGANNDKSMSHYNQQLQSLPPKPKCTLPTSVCQPGYVTPSKLFNMMGYGLENQYLLMHAHYLYIIDCRSREKFKESHIITAIHWEDALNGNVYISLVERFSEIVLYDEKGIFFNTTTEMRRVINRFSPPGSKSCILLAGGFEAFRTLFSFVCTQSDIRSTVDREKFLTIYPSVVLDNQLYLGTGHQATNWKVVRDLKLTHIINISIEHQCIFSDKIKYLHIELEDKEDVLLKDRFDETIRFMNMAFQNPSSRILIHCNLGIS